jgi:hypothetical protein
MKNFKRFFGVMLIAFWAGMLWSCTDDNNEHLITIDFQNLELDDSNFWNGSDRTGGFTINLATFKNDFDTVYHSWSGFSYSNITDIETPSWSNQYSAYITGGGNSSNIYAVCYVNTFGENAAEISFSNEVDMVSARVTNSTYLYYSLLNGDDYTQPFSDGDWFLLTITAFDTNGNEVGAVEFYLADFRNGKTTIIDSWAEVALGSLSGVKSLVFSLSSSDTGEWGMNTPAYFCLDNLAFKIEN